MGGAEGRVCPRCGSEATEHEYCQTCGLHLWGQPELPTREEWETSRNQIQATEAVGEPRARTRIATWWGQRRPIEKLGLLLAAVGVLAVIAAGPAGIVGGEEEGPAVGERLAPTEDIGASELSEQPCVDSWNDASEADNFGKGWLETSEAYAAVGFSVDFPDQCLVTLAVPEHDLATQLQETSPGSWRWLGNSSIGQVPASAKQWNATRYPGGRLSLGAP